MRFYAAAKMFSSGDATECRVHMPSPNPPGIGAANSFHWYAQGVDPVDGTPYDRDAVGYNNGPGASDHVGIIAWGGYAADDDGFIDTIGVHQDYVTEDGPAAEVYPIGIDTDTADGAYVYVTLLSAGTLYVKKIATSDLSVVSTVSLGAATIGEVTGGTYVAYPRVQEFSPSVVYVYGRMAGILHLLVSTDAGASFAEYANTFTDAYTVGAFLVGHDGALWAVENTGGVPMLWKDTGAGFVQQPAVLLEANVPPDCLTIIPSSGTIALASATNVIRSDDAGATWTDQAYPAGGDIRSLLFIA